jgi:hypothetical protein
MALLNISMVSFCKQNGEQANETRPSLHNDDQTSFVGFDADMKRKDGFTTFGWQMNKNKRVLTFVPDS